MENWLDQLWNPAYAGYTPDQVAQKRAKIGLQSRNYGNEQYIGTGLIDLIGGILNGRKARGLDTAELQGNARAQAQFGDLMGGMGGPMSILGMPPQQPAAAMGPNQDIGDAAMLAIGHPEAASANGLYTSLEQQYGLPTGYLARTAQIESGGNPNAQNPNSSASGMFQFIDSTAQQYGLTNPMDPVASAQAAARLAADNAAVLRAKLGREPTAAELYLAHQQGAGGALALLTNPGASAASVVGSEAANLNGGQGATAGDMASMWTAKFDGAAAPSNTTVSTMGGAPSGDMAQVYAVISNPWSTPEMKAMAMQIIQRQQNAPMEAIQMAQAQQQLQLGQAELDQMANPPPPSMPAGFEALHMQAVAGGLQPGTPAYQSFMLNGSDPATFQALDLQANAAGYEDGTPKYKEFMATRGAGDQAYAKTIGTAAGDAAAAAGSLESKLPGLEGVVAQLDQLANDASYTMAGTLYDESRKQLGLPPRDAAVARAEYIAIVDNQVLPLLRDTFGAAFTQKEGETLRATLGNPNMSPPEKQALLKAFIDQKKRDLVALQAQAGAGAPQYGAEGAAPPAASGQAIDFSKMGIGELGSIDLTTLSPDQQKALAARLTELGF